MKYYKFVAGFMVAL